MRSLDYTTSSVQHSDWGVIGCSAKEEVRAGAMILSLFHCGQLISKTIRFHVFQAKESKIQRFSVPSPDGPCMFQGTMRPIRYADIWKCDYKRITLKRKHLTG